MKNPMGTFRFAIPAGGLVWMILILIRLPSSIYAPTYPEIILLAGPLAVVPLGFRALGLRFGSTGLFSAFALGLSYLFPKGGFAGLLATPWILFSLYRLWGMMGSAKKPGPVISLIMLVIGAGWALADRLGWQPFGYAPLIVLLTAVHFHFAGFALTAVAQSLAFRKNRAALLTIVLSAGTAMVATGILVTQLKGPVWIETAAVTTLASGGIFTGGWLLRSWLQNPGSKERWLFLLSGCSLIAGMCLACLYGWRPYFPIPGLSIPWMYAVHGTLNSIGFAIPALIAVNRQKEKNLKKAAEKSALEK